MIKALSPFTRRVIAVGLLLVATVSLINLVLLPAWLITRNSLDQLEDARFQRAQAEAVVRRAGLDVSPPIASALYIAAPSRLAAEDQLVARVQSNVGNEIKILSATADTFARPNVGIVRATFTAEGKEVVLIDFLNRLELGPPLIRITRFRFARSDPEGTTVRLDGQVEAPWGPIS